MRDEYARLAHTYSWLTKRFQFNSQFDSHCFFGAYVRVTQIWNPFEKPYRAAFILCANCSFEIDDQKWKRVAGEYFWIITFFVTKEESCDTERLKKKFLYLWNSLTDGNKSNRDRLLY